MLSAYRISRITGGELHGTDIVVSGVAPLATAGPDHVAFLDVGDPGNAGLLIAREIVPGRNTIVVADPLAAMAAVLQILGDLPPAIIGDGCEIHPSVVLYPGVKVGNGCRIHAGTVIGAPGFRFHADRRIPHVGGVTLGDACEVGANCTIDAGMLEATSLGHGCQLDAQVHIGHNCKIGNGVVIAAQTGISGSCVIGDRAIIGGQVGLADHTVIEAGARIGAQSGVHGVVPAGATYLGTPARPIRLMRRIYAGLRWLPEIVRNR